MVAKVSAPGFADFAAPYPIHLSSFHFPGRPPTCPSCILSPGGTTQRERTEGMTTIDKTLSRSGRKEDFQQGAMIGGEASKGALDNLARNAITRSVELA